MNEKTPHLPRILKLVLAGLCIAVALLILFVNRNLAALAGFLYPGSEPWAHLALLALELVAVLWFWRGVFGGQGHLLLMDEATEEERDRFSRELARRFKKNPALLEAGITAESCDSEEAYLERSLAHLRGRADREIEQTARRIFLATALTQNGRLDALIVFFSLCRLVWRISGIYNQRPHPREIASLYWAVASSTFLALSLEELDIGTEITVGFGEALHAMLPAGFTAGIPFAGRALQTFTASTIDGAANCYLALRTGIVARNAFAYGARAEKRPSRAAVFREAGAQLYAMTGGMVERLAATLADCLAGAARNAGDKTVRAGKNLVEGVGASAGKIASGTVSAVHGTGRGIVQAGSHTVKTMGRAVEKGTGAALGAIAKPFKGKKEEQ